MRDIDRLGNIVSLRLPGIESQFNNENLDTAIIKRLSANFCKKITFDFSDSSELLQMKMTEDKLEQEALAWLSEVDER